MTCLRPAQACAQHGAAALHFPCRRSDEPWDRSIRRQSMSRSIRSFVAALLTSALILTQAACALHGQTQPKDPFDSRAVPELFDASTLRPLGILMTAVGTLGFCLMSPVVLITRPTDIGKVFSQMVIDPARYTWVEPLGTHDDGLRYSNNN
jgi:hypothetical protein